MSAISVSAQFATLFLLSVEKKSNSHFFWKIGAGQASQKIHGHLVQEGFKGTIVQGGVRYRTQESDANPHADVQPPPPF